MKSRRSTLVGFSVRENPLRPGLHVINDQYAVAVIHPVEKA
jgi:hypothetical protein